MLGRLFGSRPFLDADVEAWHLETWAWLIEHFASEVPLKSTPLVLANADFFPASDATGHARALHSTVLSGSCTLRIGPVR